MASTIGYTLIKKRRKKYSTKIGVKVWFKARIEF